MGNGNWGQTHSGNWAAPAKGAIAQHRQTVIRKTLAIGTAASLAVLLLGGCDRAALEQAFAPDPQLVEGTPSSTDGGDGLDGGDRNAPNQTGSSSSNNSTQPQTAPGGGMGLRLPGSASSNASNGKPATDSANLPANGNPSSSTTRPQSGTTNGSSGNIASGNSNAKNDAASGSEAAPAELREKVKDVLALGVIERPFAANQPVTRGEFARWLMAANNAVYGDRSALQVRSAPDNSTAVFQDVPKTHSDFAAIQGLAEAGIIPSSLSGAQEQINFKPNATLTREDLLLWKVPLDVRKTLPSSNLEAVKEAWGFQDASKISGPALRAVLADYSNGDQAVIRRVFGYTTLLQPQKPVTQAEAAAALWYFGSDGQGVSAADAPGLATETGQ